MASSQPNLPNSRYLHDFVVITTQWRINADLIQYLQNTENKPPFTYLCFLADNEGNPTLKSSLAGVMQLSGGINPFDVPDNTDYNDQRITKLNQARFVCGIRMQSGIPPGCIVDISSKSTQIELPEPIVTLGSTPDRVLFNMYCSEITIIKNTPQTGCGTPASWNWFTQQPGNPWFIRTNTKLLVSALERSLKTQYFDAHPEKREALKLKLNNISDSAFSLQQLFFDLENAVIQKAPSFVGVTNKTAESLLRENFIDIWSYIAKKQGLPLIGVTAVAQRPNASSFRATTLERWVGPVIDTLTGQPKADPSPLERSATTLNYLCAMDDHTLPGASSVKWDWIEPQDVAQASSVIAIRRSTIAAFLVKEMLRKARYSCIKPHSAVDTYSVVGGAKYSWGFSPGQEPTVNITNSGPVVATIHYSSTSSASSHNDAAYGELNIASSYSCSIVLGEYDTTVSPPVYLGGNTFTIIQNLKISPYIQYEDTGRSVKVFDKTLSDEYAISVDHNGGLASSHTGIVTSTDNSSKSDVAWLAKVFTGIGDLLTDIKLQSRTFLNSDISPIPFNEIKNFVFPGANVFSYKPASFSKYHDLICPIVYTTPTASQLEAESMMLAAAATNPVTGVPKAIELVEMPPRGEPSQEGSFTIMELGKEPEIGGSLLKKLSTTGLGLI